MKFTYLGFSQKVAVDKGLDLIDLAILRYFIDFKDSGKMVTEIIGGESYYWVKYEAIIESNPIFNITSKQVVSRRMKKLVDTGILKRYIKKEKGTYIFFAVGETYRELIEDRMQHLKVECNNVTDDFKVECTKEESKTGIEVDNGDTKNRPLDLKVDGGSTIKSTRLDLKVDTKDYSIKDTSIKDINVVVMENIKLIIFSWNKSFKTNINNITTTEDNLIRNLLLMHPVEEILKVIQEGSNSNYLNGTKNGKVADMSWFFREDNFIKVMNGFYKDKQEVKEKKPNRFHNFSQRTSGYSEEDMERMAKNKRNEYFNKVEVSK